MEIASLGNPELKHAIHGNLVSFPAQVPVFRRQARPDLQWRIAVLYFVRGWSFAEIAARYNLTRERAGQIARDWRVHSVRDGYIQEISPETRKPL